MKKQIPGKLLPAYILTFVACFMFFIYEPIMMYANNIEDFWFDIYTLIIPMIKIFAIAFICLSILYSLIYIFNKRIIKKINIYNILLIISFIAFIVLYIQGNYLIKDLPRLNGAKADWTKYTNQNITTIIVLIIVVITYIITTIKFKAEKVINISKYITLAVFGMLSVSLITTIFTSNFFIKKSILGITTENLYTYSTKNNFTILLLDAVDSRTFKSVLENSKYKETFEDFTYYPDTLGSYPFTRDSIPFILTGEWNENKTDFIEYYNNAMDNSELIKNLKEKKYNINIYESDFKLDTDTINEISNIKKLNNIGISTMNLLKQEIKYDLFKYLPYYLKKYSKIESLEFIQGNNSEDFFRSGNLDNYKALKKNSIIKTDDNMFKFVHLDGAHEPFNLDENINPIIDGTYEQKVESSLKFTNEYLNKLKENNVYDNSIIIIMADHGYNGGNTQGRQNPILYIKGINEHHKMNTSDKPISYEDLLNTYLNLLDGKKSTDLFKDIPNKRKRRYLSYEYAKENHMVEYEQTGKAWDLETLKKTGREYNR